MTPSVKRQTSAQVMTSPLLGLSPMSKSVLTVQSLKPASDTISPSLSALPPLSLCLFLSKINKHKKNFKNASQKVIIVIGYWVILWNPKLAIIARINKGENM